MVCDSQLNPVDWRGQGWLLPVRETDCEFGEQMAKLRTVGQSMGGKGVLSLNEPAGCRAEHRTAGEGIDYSTRV